MYLKKKSENHCKLKTILVILKHDIRGDPRVAGQSKIRTCIYPNVTFHSGFWEATQMPSTAFFETVKGFLSAGSYSHTLTRETLLGARSFLLYRRLREISCCLRIASVTTSFSVRKYRCVTQTLPPVTDLFLPIFKCLPHFFWRNR